MDSDSVKGAEYMAVHNGSLKEKLIEEGLREIAENGVQNFSMRRVAAACGVSCAAPYKHFKDKEEFFVALIDYIACIWKDRQNKVLETCPQDNCSRLIALSVEYVRFLVENPHVRSLIMTQYREFDEAYSNMRSRMSTKSRRILVEYCREVNMPQDVYRRKIMVVRSLIFGTALLFDSGEIEYNEESLKDLEYNISREFKLP